MRKDPIDEDHDADNPANKWAEQQAEAAEIGEAIDNRKRGEPINDLFD